MFEVELKAKVSSIEELYEYLVKELGFSAVEYVAEDYYFDHPCRDFEKSDEELRVRLEKKGAGSRVVLTYKGAVIIKDRSAREEIEASVTSDIIRILNKLGFSTRAFKRKTGWFIEGDDIEIVLCSVRGVYGNKALCLGDYIEVELRVDSREKVSEARKKVQEFLEKLPGIIEIDTEYYMEKMKKLAEID